MKLLVLNGSPKKEHSNTLKLTQAFINGLKTEESCQIEQIDISDKKIQSCLGCFGCWTKTPGVCVIRDDMDELLPKLLQSDLVIWSFPLYYFGMPSGLKAFMDRMLPLNLPFMDERENAGGAHPPRYPQMRNTRHILISTCGFYTIEHNYEALTKQFELCFGHEGNRSGLTKILCAQGELFGIPELKQRTDAYLEDVRKAGEAFMRYGCFTPDIQEKLDQLLYPKETYVKMADASWGIAKAKEPDASKGSGELCDKQDDSLPFTKQMAALYNKSSWNKKDLVLEMHYTDVNKTYQIWLQQQGSRVIEDSNNFLPYTARVETPLTVWQDIAIGKLDSMAALTEQKYKIVGSLSFMSRWDSYFGTGSKQNTEPSSAQRKKNTNMFVLLMPWLVVWIGIPIDPYWGSFAGIIGVAAIGIISLFVALTPYDCISIFCCGVICALGFIGVPPLWLIPAAYLAFGILWFVSVFLKLPLSSWYSCKDFGGLELVQKNRLFMKTNRILTACWGVLYLVTPIWTFFFMLTPLYQYISLFNSLFPIVFGIFTMWFQKWYPARKAAGK